MTAIHITSTAASLGSRRRVLTRPLVRLGGWVLVAVAVAAGLTLAVATPAAAHASLVSSDPAQGDTVEVLPAAAELAFTEEMQAPAYVVVTAPDGASVTTGDPVVAGAAVTQELMPGPAGTYTLAYRAVSEDGHPVTGEIIFEVSTGGGSAATPTEDSSSASSSSGAAPSEAAAAAGESAEDDARREAATSDGDAGFWPRHSTHVIVGALLFAVAGALLVLSRRAPR